MMPLSNVTADVCSSDSLSLTGLVCTQDQLPKVKHQEPRYYHKKATEVSENDIDFEFSYTAQSPVAVKVHKKCESSDLFELELSQKSQAAHGRVTVKDVLEARYKPSKNVIAETENGGFAQKLMQSIMTPCRSCRVVEPSAVSRTSTVQGS
ncbi:hypothetical protein R6Q59_028105 [Mikania micrantha]